MKKIATWVLVALALAGAAVAVKNKGTTKPRSPVSPPSETQADAAVPSAPEVDALPSDGVVVTYFTTNVRCRSCLRIEALTRQAVESHFAGKFPVVFRMVNVDQPGNAHFTDDYRLVSKTVVVSERKDGVELRWTNLQDVWLKLSDPSAFDAYVSGAIAGYLETPAS